MSVASIHPSPSLLSGQSFLPHAHDSDIDRRGQVITGHRIFARLAITRPELLFGDRVDEEADLIGLRAVSAGHAEVALAEVGDEGLELLGALDGVFEGVGGKLRATAWGAPAQVTSRFGSQA